jgi:hypothetical protein
VYSPSFLRYEGTGVVGLRQAWGDDGEEKTDDTGEIYEYDTSINLFPTRIHPANLYFTRTEDNRPRLFLSLLETTSTLWRGEQFLNLEDASFRVAAERREVDQTQIGAAEGPAFVDVAENSVMASGEYRISRQQTINGGYTYRDVDQDEDFLDFTSHGFNAYHTLRLGEPSVFQLRSRVEGETQDGALDQDFVRWTENLNHELTDDLRWDGFFSYTDNQNNLADFEEILGNAGLTYQLYNSLVTSYHVQGSRTETDPDSTTDTVSGTLGLAYSKSTPLGYFRMNYSNFIESRDTENGSGAVIDEQLTFPLLPPEEVRLAQPNVDLGTLIVTDPSGLFLYTEPADYTVFQDPGTGITTLTRVFTGNIPPGGDILVDYRYEIGEDFTLHTLIQDLRLEHEFRGGLTPYFRFHHQDQNIVEKDGPLLLEPVRELGLLGGVEWRRPTWLVGGEYEYRDSTILPFDAIRLRAQWSDDFRDWGRFSLRAAQSWLFYQDTNRDATFLQGQATWQKYFMRNAQFFMNGAVYYSDDSQQGWGSGFSVGGGAEYRWRGFTFRVRADYRETRGQASDFRSTEVAFWIVREFGSLPTTTDQAMNRFLRQ